MCKRFLFLPLFLFSFLANSQDIIQLRGVLLKNFGQYYSGDTVNIFGEKYNSNLGQIQYVIKMPFGNTRYINEDQIIILDDELDFWEDVWFRRRANEINKKGWESEKRQELQEDAMDYYTAAINNNLIVEDEFLYDYIYQLINEIHPVPMLKEKQRDFSVVILKSTDQTSFAFDNGMIVLTTGILSTFENENELIHLLSEKIAHVVLEHNLENFNRVLKAERRARIWGSIAAAAVATAMAVDEINSGTWYDYGQAADFGYSVYFLSLGTLTNIGAEYTIQQREEAKKVAIDFISKYPEMRIFDDNQFLVRLAPAISITAWLEFHHKNYSNANSLLQKLESRNLATDSDYFLMSKIIRKQSNDIAAYRQALDYIEKGRKKSSFEFPEFYKEEGLLNSRMGDSEKSINAFKNYRTHLLELKEKGASNVDGELRSIDQYIQRISKPKQKLTMEDASEISEDEFY